MTQNDCHINTSTRILHPNLNDHKPHQSSLLICASDFENVFLPTSLGSKQKKEKKTFRPIGVKSNSLGNSVRRPASPVAPAWCHHRLEYLCVLSHEKVHIGWKQSRQRSRKQHIILESARKRKGGGRSEESVAVYSLFVTKVKTQRCQ